MKANSYIKFTNILDLIQRYLDSIDLPKILVDSAKPTLLGETHAVGERSETCRQTGTSARFHPLRERGNAYNRQLQKHQLNRRHHSINWRWQSRLIQWI
jgi:hypothetical protein